MGDLGPAVGSLLEVFGPVVGSALKRLLRTVVGAVLFGVLCLGVAGALVVDGWVKGLALLVPGLVALVALTGVVSVKNTVLGGVVDAVERLGLGAKVVRAVSAGLGITEGSTHGERGGALTQAVERVPLKVAEDRLSQVVRGLLEARAQQRGVRAWLARALLRTVLERVQALTLGRFRDEQAQHGGVDLALVQRELGGSVDRLLARQVLAQLNRLNLLIAGGYVAFVALLAVAVTQLPPR